MKTITKTVYTFDELSDEAKEKARDWWREVSTTDVYDQSCEYVIEDAKKIGLKIEQLSQHGANEGEFIDGAFNCIRLILSNHGEGCETYKTAKEYEVLFDAVPEQDERRGEAFDAIENEFLRALLEDYRVMRDKEDEYQLSDECVDENILANEYTFTETGKREDV